MGSPRIRPTIFSGLLLFCALLCFSAGAKADPVTINFNDVAVSGSGTQQIAADRYRPQGVHINGSDGTPFVVGAGGGATSNFIFGGVTPITSSITVFMSFTVPGTGVPVYADVRATDFVSFDVISTGDTQNAQWQAIFLNNGGGYIGEVDGRGNGTLSYSTPGNLISYVMFVYNNGNRDNNSLPFSGRLGVDNLRFNAPGTPTPEPATLLLLGTGITGVAAKVRRRMKLRSRS